MVFKRSLAFVWRTLNLPKGLQLFIMRFANNSFLIGVTGVIFNENHEALLLKHTYRQTPWSLPGGYLKGGEHPLEGIAREIQEETGFKVKIIKIIKTSHDPETARLDISCYGTFIGGTFKESEEVTEHGFFAFENLPHIGTRQKKLIQTILKKETNYFEKKSSLFNRIYGVFRKSL